MNIKTMNIPILTEDDIDEIRTALSNFKEECCDGNDWDAEPGIDKDITDWTEEDQRIHDEWLCNTWTRFDELPISRLGEESGKFGEIIQAIKKAEKIGHIYEIFDDLENQGA